MNEKSPMAGAYRCATYVQSVNMFMSMAGEGPGRGIVAEGGREPMSAAVVHEVHVSCGGGKQEGLGYSCPVSKLRQRRGRGSCFPVTT